MEDVILLGGDTNIIVDEMSRLKSNCLIHFRNGEKVVTNRQISVVVEHETRYESYEKQIIIMSN